MAADLQYFASLNADQVLAALLRIDKSIDKMAKQADREFQSVGKSASASGVQIGAISGVVSSLTTAFIQLGQRAIGALVEIGQQSVQTAIEMDTLKARLGGIFDGSKEAADEAFGFIQQKSKELGIDLSELAGAFLPKTESLAQFERVAKIATALARSDPEQGAIGARIALIEALSGTFTSIQRRFEIPKEDINRIKEAFDKEGIEGFLTTLETVLAESGKSFEDLANTAQTAFDRLDIAGEQLGGRIGVPIVASLEEAANKILEFIDANEDDLIVFADTIGRSIADVIDLISSIDFGGLDLTTLQQIADYIFRIINAVQLAGSQFLALAGVFDTSNDAGDFLYTLLTNLDDALVTLAQIVALTKASFEAANAGLLPYLRSLEALAEFATGDIASGLVKVSEALKASTDLEAAQAAFNNSILESNAAFDEYYASLQGNTDAQDELRQSLDDTANAGTDAADAILAAAQAERQAAEDAEKFAEAQAKVNKAFAEAEKDFQRKLEDIDIQAERKRFDIALEFAQKREDAAEDNLEKLVDIRRKNRQDITDAATDLERKEEDIARKFADERIDLETDQRQKRVDIEKSFREKLQDIQKESAFDLEEAERTRDAVGFLRILRQRNEQVTRAQTDRQKEIDELRVTGERRKEELRIQQQRELEEASIANERKLEDLRLNLERQIEEQNIAYARQLDDIATNEQRKLDEANRARERDIEDAKRAYDRKLEDLRISLAEELAILAAGNAALEAEAARHAQAMAAAGQSNRTTSARNPREDDDTPASRPGFQNRQRQQQPTTRTGQQNQRRQRQGLGRRQFGGLVNAGGSYPVGEGGPELFVPSSNGRIVPNSALVMPSMVPKSSVNNISSSRSQEINIPMVSGGALLDPIFVAQIRNMILSELGRVL